MRFLRIALVGGFVALSSCGGGPTAPPPPPPPPPPPAPTIAVAPPTLNLTVGQVGTLTATVTNGSGTVAWSSGAPAFATVDQAGMVTGVAAGTATITATLTGQSGVSASAQAIVTAPAISITPIGITRNGQPVALNALDKAVTVEVDLVVPAGFNGSAEVLLGSVVVGSLAIVNGVPQPVGPRMSASAAEFANLVRTGILADTRLVVIDRSDFSALARTPNGSFEAIVQLSAGTEILATQSIGQVGVQNLRAVAITRHGTTGNTATDPVTMRTFGTEATLTAVAVLFDGSPAPAVLGVNLEYTGPPPGQPPIAAVGSNTGAVVNIIMRSDTDPGAGGTRGTQGRYRAIDAAIDGLPVDLLNATGGGLTGLADIFLDLDARGPDITGNPTLDPGLADAWLNQTANIFGRLGEFGWTPASNVTDGGIGGISCSVEWTADKVTFLGPVVLGGDIGPETSSANLELRVSCSDLLFNVSSLSITDGVGSVPQLIGTDFTAPTAGFQTMRNGIPGLVNGAINPLAGTPVFLWAADGAGSGFGMIPYHLNGIRWFSGLTPQGQCLVGNYAAGVCEPTDLADAIFSLGASPIGQIRLTYTAEDRARNGSAPAQIGYFVDEVSPVASNLQISGTLVAGTPFSVSFGFTDESEIAAIAGGIAYNNMSTIPISGYTPGGTPFDDQFTVSIQVQYNATFHRFAEPLVSGGNFLRPAGAGKQALDVVVGGTDFGRNVGEFRTNISALATGAFETFATGPDRVEFRQSSLQLCFNPYGPLGDCGGVPEQATVNLDFFTPAGGTNFVDEVRLSKLSTIGSLRTGFILPDGLFPVRQTFGGFFVDTYTGTLRGMDFHPGNYQLGFYGYRNGGGTMLDGEAASIPLQIVKATGNTQW